MQLTKILDVKNVSNKQLHLTLDGANFDGVPRNVLAKGRVLRKDDKASNFTQTKHFCVNKI